MDPTDTLTIADEQGICTSDWLVTSQSLILAETSQWERIEIEFERFN